MSRGFLRTLVAVLVAFGTLGAAQNDDLSSRRPENSVPADHGLLLTLSESQAPDPAGSGALNRCLADHPPLACVLLAITVENRGKGTVLRWTMSCGSADVGFDLKNSEGSWEPFSNFYDSALCSRNILSVQKLSSGESYVEHVRLADIYPGSTAFPPPDDGFIHPRHQSYAFLAASGPHIIRAHWYVDGCVATDKRKPGDVLEPVSARAMCVAGTEPKQQFIVLQSNELNLSVLP